MFIGSVKRNCFSVKRQCEEKISFFVFGRGIHDLISEFTNVFHDNNNVIGSRET